MIRSMFTAVMGLIAGMCWMAAATAQPVIDGKADPADGYGAALSVQNTNTEFGNAVTGDPISGGGNEIDQVFGRVANGRLYVTVTGNLEGLAPPDVNRFNKLEVFIDSKAGGVNTIDGAALPTGVDAFCCGGFGTTSGALQRMNGLTFDTGFDADYFLTFTHGKERVNPNLPGDREFWAVSAHYADLTQGTSGAVVAAGIQLAHRGLPNVLRFPGDYNDNGRVDAADYVVWRDQEGQTVPRGSGADFNGDQMVTDADYNNWTQRFDSDTTLTGISFVPQDVVLGVSEALLGPTLPGLVQGQLIDCTYAQGAGGCTDDTGAGCVAGELEFVLNVDPNEIGTNQSNHRNFNNTVDLQLALDNSNTIGVTGDGPYTTPTTGNPQDVTTGVEFSIPLAQIGNPTGPIKLTVFVNGGGHDFSSNQYSGTGVLAGNFGGLLPNLALEAAGDQFVSVPNPGAGSGAVLASVPEPASLLIAILALGAAVGLVRRK